MRVGYNLISVILHRSAAMIFKQIKLFYVIMTSMVGLVVGSLSDELIPQDIFKVSEINCNEVEGAYLRLNRYLVDQTSSSDQKTNFDMALNGLIQDLKDGNQNDAAAKRLFLSLSTIEGDVSCNSLSHSILYGNYCAGNRRIGSIKKNENLRRVDKIAWPLIYTQAIKCRKTYKHRYDELMPTMNKDAIDKVESFLEKIIKELMSREDNFAHNNAEKLYNVVFGQGWLDVFKVDADYINDHLKATADETDLQKVLPVEDESRRNYIDNGEVSKLYDKYIGIPCAYYVSKLGPEIFEPAYFDGLFNHVVYSDYEEYYKAWVQYKFCSNLG